VRGGHACQQPISGSSSHPHKLESVLRTTAMDEEQQAAAGIGSNASQMAGSGVQAYPSGSSTPSPFLWPGRPPFGSLSAFLTAHWRASRCQGRSLERRPRGAWNDWSQRRRLNGLSRLHPDRLQRRCPNGLDFILTASRSFSLGPSPPPPPASPQRAPSAPLEGLPM
jgi:hypothetical protein